MTASSSALVVDVDEENLIRVNLLLPREADPELFDVLKKINSRKRAEYIRTQLSNYQAVKTYGGVAVVEPVKPGGKKKPSKEGDNLAVDSDAVKVEVAPAVSSLGNIGINPDDFS